MASAATISIEIVYAEPEAARCRHVELSEPACVADALAVACADPLFADLALDRLPVGIFGRRVGRDQRLRDGDRVEIYRELPADPRSARRERVRQARKARS